MPYLGYDRCGLAVLLGAIEEAASERLALPDRPDRWCLEAADRHRRAIAAVAAFAEPIGAILRGDPLGRFRPVHMDPADLRWWAVCRSGRWATVTDPTRPIMGPQLDPAVENARLLAADLTPGRLTAMLHGDGGDGEDGEAVARYLAAIRSDRGTRAAFLDALGPDRFHALLQVASWQVVAGHQQAGPATATAVIAGRLLDGLGQLWATARREGAGRTPAWDHAAMDGDLAASSRLLAIAAAIPRALASDELAEWAMSIWERLVASLGTKAAPWPELVGPNVLTALASDGRAARRFLLGLVDPSGGNGLLAFITNVAGPPDLSGAVLLASSQPTTVATPADEDELRLTMQAVLRMVSRLLDRRDAAFPRLMENGRVDTTGTGWMLPADLGLYAGRYLDRLVDPCDGARRGACPITTVAWPGWGEREVAHLLDQLAADGRNAAELDDAAVAEFTRRLQTLDLTDGASDAALENAAFMVAAVGAVRRNRKVERAIGDDDQFGRMAAGADLVIAVAAAALPAVEPIVTAGKTWSWASHIGGAVGGPTPGELVLSPLRPRSIRDALATARADDLLRAAVLQRAAAQIALRQLQAAGRLDAVVPPGLVSSGHEVDAIDELVSKVRPGDNADAPAVAYLDDVQRWVNAHRDSPAGLTVEHLFDSVGDAAARGAAWVA